MVNAMGTGPAYDLHDSGDEVRHCPNCEKELPRYLNYCDWDCGVALAKKAGGRVRTPNGLPIGCIKADNTMLEMEHGDHPDYKFPVEIEYIADLTDDDRSDAELMGYETSDEDVRRSRHEKHALIYTDGNVALTMYECNYAMWHLRDGDSLGGRYAKQGVLRLSQESIEKIRNAFKRES